MKYDALQEKIELMFSNIASQQEERATRKLVWSLSEKQLHKVSELKPFTASTCIELTQYVLSKKAVINIQNSDDKYFLWCIAVTLYPVDRNPHRASNYVRYESEMIEAMHDITFPVALSHISKYKRQYNDLHLNNNISLNVYVFKSDSFYIEAKCHLILSKLFSCMRNESTIHYCLISHISRLVRS